MATGRFVAYLRVSTARQGASGLGLEDQKKAVDNYLNGGDWQLLDTFTEVESGKRNARPELAKALALCRLTQATLIIAKIDRLSRNSAFLMSVVEGSGEGGVVFCDLPNIPAGPVGKFLLQQMANVAELEGGLISQRTKAALAQAKIKRADKGLPPLGGWRGGPDRPYVDDKLGRAAFIANADAFAQRVGPMIQDMRDGGMGLRKIAAELKARGVVMPMGGTQWTATAVKRALARIEAPTQGAVPAKAKAR